MTASLPSRIVRIAMWSGPRNISTAMMRSWGNRPDTAVSDEPLYAFYLKRTGLDHPGRDEIIAAYESDWRKVVAALGGTPPGAKPIWFQKHMTHHLLPDVAREWVMDMCNCFLIREPREVLASYAAVREAPTLEDLGFPQQLEIFEYVRNATGKIPAVIDARDVLIDPRGMLRSLCKRLGVPFSSLMLSWPPGRRPSDGIWAEYWYGTVENSTGFIPYRPRNPVLPQHLEDLAAQCAPYYRALAVHRLTSAE